MDRRSTSPVKSTVLVGPTLRIPHPVCDRVVHKASPEESKDQERKESSLFRNDACNERSTENSYQNMSLRKI